MTKGMARHWVLWTFLGMVAGIDPDQCRINTESSFTVLLASHRNLTGHWILKVDAKRVGTGRSEEGITVETAQISSSCDDELGIVQLLATATLNPPRERGNATVSYSSVSAAQDWGNNSDVVLPEPNEGVQVLGENMLEGYVGIPGLGYYKIHTEKQPWKKAQEICEQEGAHLMVIDTDVEAAIFQSLHKHHRDAIENTGWNNVHVGIHDPESNGMFVTIHGNPVNSSRWYQGKPSHTRGSCGTALHDSQLYNWDCESHRAFICERAAL